jgi:hypothetical protein
MLAFNQHKQPGLRFGTFLPTKKNTDYKVGPADENKEVMKNGGKVKKQFQAN